MRFAKWFKDVRDQVDYKVVYSNWDDWGPEIKGLMCVIHSVMDGIRIRTSQNCCFLNTTRGRHCSNGLF